MIVVVWTGENDTKMISVDANLFENGAKQLRFRLKTDQGGRGLRRYQIPCQMKPGILKLTIRRGQNNFRIVFIFVSCQENGYYRVVSL